MNSSTSNFKRFAIRFFLPVFLCLAVLLSVADWVVTNQIIFKTEMSGAAKLHRMISRSNPDEVPILGSSRALGSYFPDSIFPKAYNYGINGVNFDVTELLLNFELKKPGKAPILINFDYAFWSGTLGDLNTYKPLAWNSEVRDFLREKGEFRFWYLIPGIRYFNGYDVYMKEFLNQRLEITKMVSKGASLELGKMTPAAFNKLVKERLESPAEWKLDSAKDQQFRRLILSRKDRQFYIVVAPYHRSFYQSFQNIGDAREYLKSLDALENVRVIDISGESYPDSLFMNTTHLNFKGALRFSGELKREITGHP